MREFPDANKSGRADRSGEKVPLQQLDLLIRQIDSLPVYPESIARVLKVVSNHPDRQAVASVVRTDPAIAIRLLSLACSKGIAQKVQTVEQCLDVLSLEEVRSAVLSMPVVEDARQGVSGFEYGSFRAHCVATACAAEMLTRRVGGDIDPALGYICGLVHDIGKLALEQFIPKTYRRILQAAATERKSLIFCEREIIGIDHTIVGRRLGRNWAIPIEIQEVIWLHHQPLGAVPSTTRIADLVMLVQLADILAWRSGFGFGGNCTYIQDISAVSAELGLSREAIADIADTLPDRLEEILERHAGTGPGSAITREVSYGSVIAKTGAELAKLNETLSRQADAMDRYADVLDGLERFSECVSPATSLHKVCEEIARVFASAARLEPSVDEPVCAFSFTNHSHVVLSACTGPAGRDGVVYRLSQSRGIPSSALLSPTLVHSAGEIIRPLLRLPDAWSDLVDLDHYLCIVLPCQSELVGGVLLPERLGKDVYNQRVFQVLSRVMGFILAALGDRARADVLAEQLAQASQRLEEVQQVLTFTRALAEVGEMAAGAGHEINNPLAVISGRAQLLANRAKTKKDKETAELIARKAQEISEIITELMSFARPTAPSVKKIDVPGLLETVKERFISGLPRKPASVSVDIDIDPDCPPVRADVKQIEEVMVELLNNAYVASAGRVNIRIHASRDRSLLRGNAAVLIKVRDDGPGMDKETLESAFTPFFSRRQAGRGRGMGLTHARRIIESNDGRIWIESQPGEGTTVFVELPQAIEQEQD